MDLWIRSQDGKLLKKAETLWILEYEERAEICHEWTTFGIYKTKERALQILDEIQNILQPIVIYHEPKLDYNNLIDAMSKDVCLHTTQQVEMELKQVGQIVYQMPKE